MTYDNWLDSADPGLLAEEPSEIDDTASLLASVPEEEEDNYAGFLVPSAWEYVGPVEGEGVERGA